MVKVMKTKAETPTDGRRLTRHVTKYNPGSWVLDQILGHNSDVRGKTREIPEVWV